MRGFNVEALVYCIAWAALALVGWRLGGWPAGIALSLGLFPVIFLTSAMTLSRTGNFALERGIRWGILLAAGIVLLALGDLSLLGR